jgi:hypothetical protein|eukprot:COSAG03_NODE_939_length_5261_cov_3.306470_2_plen_163_part_00
MALRASLLLCSTGNMAGLISQPGTIMFSFYFFERFRYLGGRVLPGADQLIAFLAGGLAQSAAVVIMYPARVAKDKLQGQRKGTYTGLGDVLRKTCAYQKPSIIMLTNDWNGNLDDNEENLFARRSLSLYIFKAKQSKCAQDACRTDLTLCFGRCRCCRGVVR